MQLMFLRSNELFWVCLNRKHVWIGLVWCLAGVVDCWRIIFGNKMGNGFECVSFGRWWVGWGNWSRDDDQTVTDTIRALNKLQRPTGRPVECSNNPSMPRGITLSPRNSIGYYISTARIFHQYFDENTVKNRDFWTLNRFQHAVEPSAF